jgi:cytoskeletal protein RodZ
VAGESGRVTAAAANLVRFRPDRMLAASYPSAEHVNATAWKIANFGRACAHLMHGLSGCQYHVALFVLMSGVLSPSGAIYAVAALPAHSLMQHAQKALENMTSSGPSITGALVDAAIEQRTQAGAAAAAAATVLATEQGTPGTTTVAEATNYPHAQHDATAVAAATDSVGLKSDSIAEDRAPGEATASREVNELHTDRLTYGGMADAEQPEAGPQVGL